MKMAGKVSMIADTKEIDVISKHRTILAAVVTPSDPEHVPITRNGAKLMLELATTNGWNLMAEIFPSEVVLAFSK